MAKSAEELDQMADDIEKLAEEEASFHKVELIGPREGFTGVLAGFRFVNGITEVPTKLPNADVKDSLRMLRNFHNAHVKDSPSHQKAKELWAANPKNPRKNQPAQQPAQPQTDGDKRDLSKLQLSEMTNRELILFAKQEFNTDIDKPGQNKLKLIESVNELISKREYTRTQGARPDAAVVDKQSGGQTQGA